MLCRKLVQIILLRRRDVMSELVQIILLRSRDVMSEVGTNNITKKKRCYVGSWYK